MFSIKKWLVSGFLIAVFVAGCGILPIPAESTETARPLNETPTPDVNQNPTVTPQNTPSPDEPQPSLIEPESIAALQEKIQLPFENPIAAAWDSADNSFTAYSMDGLKSYSLNSFAAVNASEFDNSAQFLDLSPDGKLIAQTRDMATVEIVDLQSAQVLMTIDPETMINTADFSPDSQRLLITSMDEAIAFEYDLTSAALLDSYTGFEFAGPVYTVIYDRLSGDLLWFSRGSAMVQSHDTHETSGMFYHEDFINSLALSADGNTLAVSTAKTQDGSIGAGIQFWDRSNGTDLGFMKTSTLSKSLNYTNEGGLLIGADGDKLCAWNPQTMELTYSFEGHSDLISFVSLSPDDRRILTGSFDNTIILWTIP